MNFKYQNLTLNGKREKQTQRRNIWLFTALALDITSIIIFILTENINYKMALTDNWTIVNAILLIAEIICLTIALKHKRYAPEQEEKQTHSLIQ